MFILVKSDKRLGGSGLFAFRINSCKVSPVSANALLSSSAQHATVFSRYTQADFTTGFALLFFRVLWENPLYLLSSSNSAIPSLSVFLANIYLYFSKEKRLLTLRKIVIVLLIYFVVPRTAAPRPIVMNASLNDISAIQVQGLTSLSS